MNEKWRTYDRLIESVPHELTVQDLVVGCAWTMVKTEIGCGVALTVRQRAGRELMPDSIIGKSLRDAAALVKSWNFIEASIGMAAINACFNHPKRVENLGIMPEGVDSRRKSDVFSLLGDEVKGKKVAVIGRFPNLEKQLKPISELTVLEREPQKDDYPDSACEYILDEQDYVIITGMTFTNKTLPRLLELAGKHSEICLVGPSVPLAELLADYGVSRLSGYCATDAERVEEAIKRGVKQGIFDFGHMVDYKL